MKTHYESKLMQILSGLCDLMLLQLAFLVTSLPVFTVGPGLMALFSVSKKLREDSVTSVLKEYFLQFRNNFVTGTVLWLVILLLFGITWADARFCGQWNSLFGVVGQIISYILMIGVILMAVYAFPQAAWFENTVSRYLKNSLLLALSHPLTTLLSLLLYGAVAAAAAVVPLAVVIIGISGVIYLTSGLFLRVFFPSEAVV